MSAPALSPGMLLAIPLKNGLLGSAQVLSVGDGYVAVGPIDREEKTAAKPDEPLKLLEGGLIDVLIIEFFPAAGCPFEVIGERPPLAIPDADPFEILEWEELPDVIYWRGCHGMGDAAEQARREFESRTGWAAMDAEAQTEAVRRELRDVSGGTASGVNAVFWQDTPYFGITSFLELAKVFKNRERRKNPWDVLPTNALVSFLCGDGPVAITVESKTEELEQGSLVGGIQLNRDDFAILFSDEELRAAWASDTDVPPLLTNPERKLPTGSGNNSAFVRAPATRRVDVTIMKSTEFSAAPKLKLVTATGSVPDFAELRDQIERRATDSQRKLLSDYNDDPTGTWSLVQSWNLQHDDQLSAAQVIASEMARRATYNLNLLIHRLQDAHVDFTNPPIVFAQGGKEHLDRVEDALGLRLPLALAALLQHIDSVDLRGTHEIDLQTEDADAFMMHPLMEGETTIKTDHEQWFTISPDPCHKAGYSGGEDYWVLLSDYCVDPRCITNYTSKHPMFVDYLRLVLDRGGYPGLRQRPVPSTHLKSDLVPF